MSTQFYSVCLSVPLYQPCVDDCGLVASLNQAVGCLISILIFILKIYLFYVYGCLPESMYTTCVQYHWRPEEGRACRGKEKEQ